MGPKPQHLPPQLQPMVFLPDLNPKQVWADAQPSSIRWISVLRENSKHGFLSGPKNGFQQNRRIEATPERLGVAQRALNLENKSDTNSCGSLGTQQVPAPHTRDLWSTGNPYTRTR